MRSGKAYPAYAGVLKTIDSLNRYIRAMPPASGLRICHASVLPMCRALGALTKITISGLRGQ